MQSIVPPAGWLSRTVKYTNYFFSRYHQNLIFVHLNRVLRRRGTPLFRESFDRRDNSKNVYLRVLFAFRGLYQAHAEHLLKRNLLEVNYHWFSCDSWRPKEARYVWGRSVKCLGLIAGVTFTRLTPPSAPYFLTRSQFRSPRVRFWKRLLHRLQDRVLTRSFSVKVGADVRA